LQELIVFHSNLAGSCSFAGLGLYHRRKKFLLEFGPKAESRHGFDPHTFVETIEKIGCSASGVAQNAMKEDAPHARGVSKATIRRLVVVKTR
jgi:hypothetical protein